MDDNTQILVQIVAPFGGVFVAFLIGVEYDRWKKRKDRKTDTLDLINLLIIEIMDLQYGLEDPQRKIGEINWDKKERKFLGTHGISDSPVLESSINSGRFLLLSSELQSDLSAIRLQLKHYNWFTEQIMRFHQFGLYSNPTLEDREANSLVGFIKTEKQSLLKSFNEILTKLSAEKLRIKQKQFWQ